MPSCKQQPRLGQKEAVVQTNGPYRKPTLKISIVYCFDLLHCFLHSVSFLINAIHLNLPRVSGIISFPICTNVCIREPLRVERMAGVIFSLVGTDELGRALTMPSKSRWKFITAASACSKK